MIDDSDFDKMLPKEFDTDTVFVHTCFMSLFSGMLNWIGDVLYPRFNYKVITTYDKAVEVFNKKKQNVDGQTQAPFLPALTLDPILDFSNEERAGRFLWMFRHLDSSKDYNWNSIKLTDQGVTITPMFTRYQGTCEVTAWLCSMYELIDFRTRMIQFCGGYQRWIRPEIFWTHLILPKNIIEANGPEGKLDWSGINPEIITLESTATKEYALPFGLDAMWRLDSMNDSTNKMGADQIAEYKQSCTFTWECNIPTWIKFKNYQYPIEKININVGTTPAIAKYPLKSGLKLYRSLDLYKEIVPFSKRYVIFNIEDNYATPLIQFPEQPCCSWPEIYPGWNHYVCGKILDVSKIENPEDIKESNTILLIEQYSDELLPYVRRCKGLISIKDNKSSKKLLRIVKDYNISFVFNIQDQNLESALKSIHNRLITFDPIGMIIYDGIKKIRKYSSTDDFTKFVFNYNIVKIIKKFHLENSVESDKVMPIGQFNLSHTIYGEPNVEIAKFTCNQNQHEFKLDFIINKSSIWDIKVTLNGSTIKNFTLNGMYLVINDRIDVNCGDVVKIYKNDECNEKSLRLLCNRLMTKQDEINFHVNKKFMEVDLKTIRSCDYSTLYCISYNGLMNQDFDFVVDPVNKIIKFNIVPKRDNYIQIYGCV